jgi:sulfur carrier protein ThiS
LTLNGRPVGRRRLWRHASKEGSVSSMSERDQLNVRLFGGLEAQTSLGAAHGSVPATGLATVADLLRAIGLPEGTVGLILANGLHVKLDAPLTPGDEVSLFPFVGGG